ncbi:FHA domain-containing protein [Pseudonocardia nigra]|uniref:FHA domain-containing protein n=1 Tax=Pseudonocardia nigra TaxID=1921578 RepID=UPI001C5E3858|nr:FHA domain-containing protein [Pseudonocardia nigra]
MPNGPLGAPFTHRRVRGGRLIEMGFDEVRAVAVPGEGVVVRLPGLLCVAQCADRDVLRRLLDVCEEAAGPEPGRVLARLLAAWLGGPDAPQADLRFGTVADAGERWAVFLFGAVGIAVPGRDIALSGADSVAWTDRLLPRQDVPVELTLEGTVVPSDIIDGLHDLRSGVVAGAAAVLVPRRSTQRPRERAAESAWGEPRDERGGGPTDLWFSRAERPHGDDRGPARPSAGGVDDVRVARRAGQDRAPDHDEPPRTRRGEPDPGWFDWPTAGPPGIGNAWVDPGVGRTALGANGMSHAPARRNGAHPLGSGPGRALPGVRRPGGPGRRRRADDEEQSRRDRLGTEPRGIDVGGVGPAGADHVEQSFVDPGGVGPGGATGALPVHAGDGADADPPPVDGLFGDPVGAEVGDPDPVAGPESDDVAGIEPFDAGHEETDAGPAETVHGGPDEALPGEWPTAAGTADAGERRFGEPWPAPAVTGADDAYDTDGSAGFNGSAGLHGGAGFNGGTVNGSAAPLAAEEGPVEPPLEEPEPVQGEDTPPPDGDRGAAADREEQDRGGWLASGDDPGPETAMTPALPLPRRSRHVLWDDEAAAAAPEGAEEGTPRLGVPQTAQAGARRPPVRAERILGVAPAEPPRPPLEHGAPVGAEVVADDAPDADVGPLARGHQCGRGHLNDPRVQFCTLCGVRMPGNGDLVVGARPPLGLLLFDDGAAYSVDAEYLAGRMPEADARVRSGTLRPLVVEDRSGAVSRVHAEIRMHDWDVLLVDTGSRNGTFVAPPGEQGWSRLPAGQSRRLVHGTRVRLGGRTFVFESPSGAR